MGTLILTMHTSADGFVATDDGEMWPAFGWPPEAQAHLNDLYREAAAVITGGAATRRSCRSGTGSRRAG